jgi:hypothetical protein
LIRTFRIIPAGVVGDSMIVKGATDPPEKRATTLNNIFAVQVDCHREGEKKEDTQDDEVAVPSV